VTRSPPSLTFPEGLELEKQTGMGVGKYQSELADGTTRASAAVFWIAAVKQAALRDGVPFRDAAKVLTFEKFGDSLDLLATLRSVRRPEVPEDPTQPAGDGSTASTSPATSEPLPSETPSPEPEATTSDSSPTTSESAPGSGTTSPSPTSAP
jgi:hypothetical protein